MRDTQLASWTFWHGAQNRNQRSLSEPAVVRLLTKIAHLFPGSSDACPTWRLSCCKQARLFFPILKASMMPDDHQKSFANFFWWLKTICSSQKFRSPAYHSGKCIMKRADKSYFTQVTHTSVVTGYSLQIIKVYCFLWVQDF